MGKRSQENQIVSEGTQSTDAESKLLSVCMFSNLYPPIVSGSSSHCSQLARELSLRGHRVAVITAHLDRSTPTYESDDGVSVFRLPAMRLPRLPIALNFPWLGITASPANLRRIRAILTGFGPDLLHAHNHMFDISFMAARVAHARGLPLVLTLHTVIAHSSQLYNALLTIADRHILRRIVVNRAASIIAPDVNIRDYARYRFGRNSHIIPYGVRRPSIPENLSSEELRLRLGLEKARVILSIGHVHDIRNRHDLVRALPLVLKHLPNTYLVIVGDVMTQTTQALAEEVGVYDRIRFIGRIPHEQIGAYMSLADIEVHWLNQESVERTSCGIATLEAMAFGLPTITSANPDTYGKGVLRDGTNIIQVPRERPDVLAEKIILLLGDGEVCTNLGAEAEATIKKHFSWDKVCATTLDVYNGVVTDQRTEYAKRRRRSEGKGGERNA